MTVAPDFFAISADKSVEKSSMQTTSSEYFRDDSTIDAIVSSELYNGMPTRIFSSYSVALSPPSIN